MFVTHEVDGLNNGVFVAMTSLTKVQGGACEQSSGHD